MKDSQEAAGWSVWFVGTVVSWMGQNAPAAVAALGGLLWAGLRWYTMYRETLRQQDLADAEAKRKRILDDDSVLHNSLTIQVEDLRGERDEARAELADMKTKLDRVLQLLPDKICPFLQAGEARCKGADAPLPAREPDADDTRQFDDFNL